MKFEISATSCWEAEDFTQKYVPELRELGFNPILVENPNHWRDYYTIELSSLDDLMAIAKKVSSFVFKDFSNRNSSLDGHIELYDSYRE